MSEPTIADLYGLDDPRKQRPPPIIVPERPFIDPEDCDDSMIYGAASLSVFHRLTMPQRRLGDLVRIDKAILYVALDMRNTSTGCWLVFTSARVARRIATNLSSAHIDVVTDICNRNGTVVTE